MAKADTDTEAEPELGLLKSEPGRHIREHTYLNKLGSLCRIVDRLFVFFF